MLATNGPPILLVVGAAALLALLSMGIRASIPLYQVPMLADVGWEGRSAFAMAIAIQNLMWGILGPVFGGLADKFGPARVLMFGAALSAAGLALMAFSTDPLSFTITAGLIAGSGQAAAGMGIALGAVGRMVPAERRSWAFGIVTMGSSAGFLVILPVGQIFLESFGWSMGVLALGLLACLMIPLAYPMSGKATGPTVGAAANLTIGGALREAFQHRSYILLITGFFVCGFHVAFIGTHLPAYITDLGLEAKVGAIALMLIGIVNILGAYISGVLGDRISKPWLLSAIYIGRAFVIAGMLLAPASEWTIYAFSAGMGLLWLSTVPLTSALVGVMFGTQYMTMLMGFVFFSHQVGSFLGVYLGGLLFDVTGSYTIVWWIGAGLGIFAAIVHIPISEKPVVREAPAV